MQNSQHPIVTLRASVEVSNLEANEDILKAFFSKVAKEIYLALNNSSSFQQIATMMNCDADASNPTIGLTFSIPSVTEEEIESFKSLMDKASSVQEHGDQVDKDYNTAEDAGFGEEGLG